jgi:hypothetical protein
MSDEKNVRPLWRAIANALPRSLLLLTVAWALLYTTTRYAEILQVLPASEYVVPMLTSLATIIFAIAVARVILNVFDPYTDGARLVEEVLRDGNTAAGLVYLGRTVLAGVIIIVLAGSFGASNAHAAGLSANAKQHIPLFKQEQTTHWASLKYPSYMAGQIEQESLWNPKAQLKTYREQGVGFGQQTRAWTATGALRFDALTAIVKQYPKELAGYSWETWDKRPDLSMRATVLMTRDLCTRMRGTDTQQDMFRMCLAAYNGGEGGLNKDRLACRAKAGCNPNVWFGNVEHTSLKSRVPMPGYGGRSAFDINREYVRNIEARRIKYVPFVEQA